MLQPISVHRGCLPSWAEVVMGYGQGEREVCVGGKGGGRLGCEWSRSEQRWGGCEKLNPLKQ